MSGLMNAIGRGASAAGYGVGEYFAKSALMDQQSDLELNRQQRLLELKAIMDDKELGLKTERANQERDAQAVRIDKKADELAGQQVEAKRGLVDAGITDRSTWTPEMQASVDQSLEQDRKTAKGKLRTEAAIATGDISPKDAAGLEYKQESMVYKALLDAEREGGKDRRLQMTLDQREKESQQRMEMLMQRLASGDAAKSDKAMVTQMMSVIENTRKDITSEATNLRQLYQAQIKDKSKGEVARIDAEYSPKFDAVDQRRQANDLDLKWARERIGMPKAEPSAAPKPAPAPAPKPAAAASGSRPPLSSFERK